MMTQVVPAPPLTERQLRLQQIAAMARRLCACAKCDGGRSHTCLADHLFTVLEWEEHE